MKTRGTFGEIQLGALLDEVFTPEQYGRNVETVPNSNARVDFAIRLRQDMEAFLRQDMHVAEDEATTRQNLRALLNP